MSLAVFHSMVIALGGALFLPFVHRYSASIERLLPDRRAGFTRFLDKSLLPLPSFALEAIGRSTPRVPFRSGITAAARTRENPNLQANGKAADSVNLALTEVRSYLTNIEMAPRRTGSPKRAALAMFTLWITCSGLPPS